MTALHCPINILKGPDALNICRDCGIVLTGVTQKTPCPPWSSEEKKEERVNDDELSKLRDLNDKVSQLWYHVFEHRWGAAILSLSDIFRVGREAHDISKKLEAQK